ncbi:MAG: hypothetical protein IT438_12240 [Phycisphaerales bacterium]|nr:hypothetical protein [Phycisphaerales bacterium]
MTQRSRSSHARAGRVLVQMGVIIAVGFVIGLADAFVFRRVNLDARSAPPTPDEAIAGAATGTRRPADARPGTEPAEPAPSPVPDRAPRPVGQPPAAATQSAPAAPGSFAFTPKDKLPAGHITVEDARKLFDAGATFVDSRKAEEYSIGHVENALRMDTHMFKDGDPPKLALIPREALVVVYCNGGHCDESENLARLLDGSGYKKVYVLHDGFPGWQAAGHPSATGTDPFDMNP